MVAAVNPSPRWDCCTLQRSSLSPSPILSLSFAPTSCGSSDPDDDDEDEDDNADQDDDFDDDFDDEEGYEDDEDEESDD